MRLQKFEHIWRFVVRQRVVSLVLGHGCVLLVLALLVFGSGWGANLLGAFAQSRCASGDAAYVVRYGDTLSGIAARYHMDWQRLATYNHIGSPYTIYGGETVCVPNQVSHQPGRGSGNHFPYGQCTWWANQRYHALHGVYVPWLSQANAWQWTARARQFYWQVSNRASPGAIVNLQPWVQGAYGLGHVAVVEKILTNGHVIASNMNWGAHPSQVTYVEFAPGPGVTFISF
ncbi:MAG TPA: CHAP domain-containing protein [Ktedonobacteraceae bacterium]